MKTCPYHLMLEYLQMLAETFPQTTTEGSFPLFPARDGTALSKKATAEAVRMAATTAGVPLTRQIDSVTLERFGEHAMRVSGAQHLTRFLLWELYLVQLFGRWGSMAVAKYVQDTPLMTTGKRDRTTSLNEVVKMIQDFTASKQLEAGTDHDSAISDMKKELQQIRASLDATNVPVLEDLIETVQTAPPHKLEKLMVQNLDSGIVHEVLVNKHPLLPVEACRTVCGWRWALARHGTVGPIDTMTGPSCNTCLTRRTAEASESETQDEEDEDDAEDQQDA